jgi:hypothetical protein
MEATYLSNNTETKQSRQVNIYGESVVNNFFFNFLLTTEYRAFLKKLAINQPAKKFPDYIEVSAKAKYWTRS